MNPLTIRGGQALKGLTYSLPMASAQVKSALLLAGLYAEGETAVTEPAPTRDHTERMLRGFGYPVVVEGATASVESGHALTATHIEVPGDISSAAFFLVAASIAEGSELLLEHVGINPTRTGVIDILRLMGANITLENQREVGGEPVADLRVRAAALKGIEIPDALVPLAIDEFPVLFVAAACAEGRTVLRGAEELRVKESDRIQVMADGLLALGVKCEATADGLIIDGGLMGGGEVCQQFQGFFIGQVNAMIACGKSQQAVQRAGIQQTPAQALGQDAGDRAFARAAWPVDGYHRCFDIHN
jgi:3-phosphoshikimate 1-carboxyvinyltransferase